MFIFANGDVSPRSLSPVCPSAGKSSENRADCYGRNLSAAMKTFLQNKKPKTNNNVPK